MNVTLFENVWVKHLRNIIDNGIEEMPRGMKTKALYDVQLTIDPRQPILYDEKRKLNYRFMFAEAAWILGGYDTVESIAPWNRNITQFSDDGVTFWGAYGPMIRKQLDGCVASLNRDWMTRQAVMSIWKPNPPMTKDVPCTLMVSFRIDRLGYLHQHVVMRSSDAWLGLPYDVFNFAMLQSVVASMVRLPNEDIPHIGKLTYTLINAHLYEQHFEAAHEIIESSAAEEALVTVTESAKQPVVKPFRMHTMLNILHSARDRTKSSAARKQWIEEVEAEK
jgi:thymidylate synthase